MAKYGLIGNNISYSFSKTFFSIKFEKEKRNDTYHNFDIDSIEMFDSIISSTPELKGLNVTIPYKEAIIPKLDRIHKEAAAIGAVNTIKITKTGKLIGYNTDHYGFAKSLADYLPIKEKTALILGTGGASKAIAFVLDIMGFNYIFVSRTKAENTIRYETLNQKLIGQNYLIVNTTPLGTFPDVREYPNIPYQYLTKDHLLFDLIYNPHETEFLKRGFAKGARVVNGLKMLEYQAKKSWAIWKK
jgi:shikimate dehydrogenase